MSLARRREKPKSTQMKAAEDLASEIARAEKEANERFAVAESQANEEQKNEREKYLRVMRQWGPTLYLFPMIPALFGVVTICVVSVVSNTDNRQADGNLCNSGFLNTYLLLSQVLAYFFLFGYGCMFIGTKIQCCCWKIDFHCQKIRTIVYFYIVTLVAGVGINGFGAWAIATSAQCGDPLNTPYTYRVAQMEAAFFWACAIVAGIFGLWFNGKKKMEKMAVEKAQKREEDAQWEAEEAEREAHAEQQQQQNENEDWFADGPNRRCPECESLLPQGAEMCPECGTPVGR